MKKRLAGIALLAMVIVACDNASKETQVENNEEITTEATEENVTEDATTKEVVINEVIQPRGAIYRCVRCSPGMEVEYVQVAYDVDQMKIDGIWLWDQMQGDKPGEKEQMIILEQDYHEGEISGYTGVFQYPGVESAVYNFGSVGETFALEFGETRFEYEYFKSE